MLDDCDNKYNMYQIYSEDHYETQYKGFFVDNKRCGEGCIELRDDDFDLAGWYLGRFENGVRHGIGKLITILPHNLLDDIDRYRMVD